MKRHNDMQKGFKSHQRVHIWREKFAEKGFWLCRFRSILELSCHLTKSQSSLGICLYEQCHSLELCSGQISQLSKWVETLLINGTTISFS